MFLADLIFLPKSFVAQFCMYKLVFLFIIKLYVGAEDPGCELKARKSARKRFPINGVAVRSR